MSARTHALVSQQETGKITESIVLRYVRLPNRRELLIQRVRSRLFLILLMWSGAIEAIGLGRTGRKSPTLQWHKRGKHDHQSTGWQRQGKASRGGKLVRIWAVEDDWDAANLRSNMFEMEVPPRSGRAVRKAASNSPTGSTSF